MINIGYHVDGSNEYKFGIICGNESKKYLVLIIYEILLCGIGGEHVALDHFFYPYYHVIHLFIRLIVIQMPLTIISFSGVLIKVIINLITLCK